MTGEEAIEELKDFKNKSWDGMPEEVIDIAIKALEQEPCDDVVSRQTVKEQMIKYGFHAPDMTVTEFVEDLPSVRPQEPCDDAISRQAVLDLMRSLTRWCVRSEDGKFDNVGLLYDDVMFGIDKLPPARPQEPKTGHCKECKWWKDSDGLYRRGNHAESKCPINRREVFEGNGYCYMFEPQESEVEE